MSQLESDDRLRVILEANPVRHRSILYWSILNLVDHRESVVLVDVANSFVEYLARESTDCPVIRAFSLAACEKYGAWVEPSLDNRVQRKDFTAVYPSVLGDKSAILEYQFYNCLAVDSGPLSLRIKQETLDFAFSGLSAISFVYINDPLRLAKILDGGSSIVEKQRPIIATPNLGEDELLEVNTWCENNDYKILDSCMEHYEVSGNESVHLADMFMFPKESLFIADACKKALLTGVMDGLGVLRKGSKPLPLGTLVEDVNLNLVNSFGVETGVIEPFIYGRELAFPLDNMLAKNWYAFEQDQELEWRWSGPDKDSIILLNIPAPGFYHVILGVMNLVDDSLKGTAKLYVNGARQIKAGHGAVEGGTIVADFYVPDEGFDGVAELLLSLPHTKRASPEDSRLLGLAVKSANLYWRA